MITKLLQRFMTPPDCRDVAEVLQSYLDGELPESQTHLVEEHLEHCDRCGIEAAVYEEVKRSLERLATPPNRDALDRLHTYADQLASDDAS